RRTQGCRSIWPCCLWPSSNDCLPLPSSIPLASMPENPIVDATNLLHDRAWAMQRLHPSPQQAPQLGPAIRLFQKSEQRFGQEQVCSRSPLDYQRHRSKKCRVVFFRTQVGDTHDPIAQNTGKPRGEIVRVNGNSEIRDVPNSSSRHSQFVSGPFGEELADGD